MLNEIKSNFKKNLILQFGFCYGLNLSFLPLCEKQLDEIAYCMTYCLVENRKV